MFQDKSLNSRLRVFRSQREIHERDSRKQMNLIKLGPPGGPLKNRLTRSRVQEAAKNLPSTSGSVTKQSKKKVSASDSEDDYQEFEVERVVGRRLNKGRLEYQIKWLNYKSTQNTWEPLYHLKCYDLIEIFERRQMMLYKDKKESPKGPGSTDIENDESASN